MVKIISIIGFLSVAFPFNASAHDGDRIVQLEREIQEIKHRLSKLESVPSVPSNAQQSNTSAEGWKSVANWRKLTTDMTPSEVRGILGEPQRIDGGNIAFWEYQNGGRVTFMRGKVFGWTEPHR
jgi:hypothetical protein